MKKQFTASDHIQAFRNTKQKGLELIKIFGPDKFNRKPDSDTWSLAEILDHINFVDKLYVNRIANKLEETAPEHSPENEYRHRLWVRLSCSLLEPPYRIKFKVPGDNPPRSDLSQDEIRDRYAGIRDTLIKQVNEGSRFPMGRIKVKSPLSDWISLTLSEAFSFLGCHQRRHLWQAEQILKCLD